MLPLSTLAYLTKSLSSHFTQLRRFYRALNNEVLSPKIFVSLTIVSSKFISLGCCSGVVNTPISMDNMGSSGLYNARHFYLQGESTLIV